MRPLDELKPDRTIEVLFFDIDDTFTHHGHLRSEALAALERWRALGRQAVAVTGRPAGWCDHFARMWPIDAVIGENGAFWFAYAPVTNTLQRNYLAYPEPGEALQVQINHVKEQVLARHPTAALASDQAYRLYDLAIDFAEDVRPALSLLEAEAIAQTMRSLGMTAKVSSIHVNGWFGTHNKQQACLRWLEQTHGWDERTAQPRCVYVGDSLNDEPMFAKFQLSVGVANIAPFLGLMKSPPAFITRAEASDGFCELVTHLLGEQAAIEP